MTTGDLVRRLIASHVAANDTDFHAAAQAFIEEERKKNHHVLARDLEKALWSSEKPTNEALALLKRNDAPKDKDRGTLLLELANPRRTLNSLVLAPRVQGAIDRLLEENRHSELLRTNGLRPAHKILFCGPPGCGKTVAAEAIARELHLPIALVRFDTVVSSYLGETAANMRRIFEFAKTRPMVLLFDEVDAIGKRRTNEEEHGELKRSVNSFLQMLDAFRAETLIIAATNHQDMLDPALWRRFDDIVFFSPPKEHEIQELLVKNLRQVGLADDVDLMVSSKELSGLSHADVERIAQDAVKATLLARKKRVDKATLDHAVRVHKERLDVAHARRTDS